MKILLFREQFVDAICSGLKTQTRRIRSKGFKEGDLVHCKTRFLGPDFAVVRMTKDERRERLQDLSCEDILSECIEAKFPGAVRFRDEILRTAFEALWDSINQKPGTRWEDNPVVSVYEFELVEEWSPRMSHYRRLVVSRMGNRR